MLFAVSCTILVCANACFAKHSDLAEIDDPAGPTALAAQIDLPKKTDLAERPRRPLLVVVTKETMNSELAEDLEITDMIRELYDMEHVPSPQRMRDLRVKIRETIIECYMDASSVEAEARREQNNLQAVVALAQAKIDRAVNYNNAINFLTTGTLSVISNSLELAPTTPLVVGNTPALVAGAVSTALSAYAMKQNAGPKIAGQNQSNMLAELFGRPIVAKTTYPESVWRFFHENSPRKPGYKRSQVLEKEWIDNGYLEKTGSRKAKQKLDFVCGMPTSKKCMTLGDLTNEIDMLGDVEALAGLMHHHLRDLLSLIDTDVLESHTGSTSLPP
jgi:hypothetical protein